MAVDSMPIVVKGQRPDSLTTMVVDAASSIQYKLFAFMFLIFVVLSTDVFINRVLSKFTGAVDQKYPTNYGTLLTGLFMVLACATVDVCIKQKII